MIINKKTMMQYLDFRLLLRIPLLLYSSNPKKCQWNIRLLSFYEAILLANLELKSRWKPYSTCLSDSIIKLGMYVWDLEENNLSAPRSSALHPRESSGEGAGLDSRLRGNDERELPE
jgi:hypothetical protein